MATIVTRAGKGSPLTNTEVDANFTNLNTDKADPSGATFTVDVTSTGFAGDITGAVLFQAKAGEGLTKGDPVYISGISGNQTVVSKADANDANKMPCFGIVDATVSINANCSVVTFGTLSSLNTSAFSEGDELYISDTGTLSATAPTGEASQLQKIAKVTRSHASAGSIKVMGAGRTNATPNLDDGKFFLGNSSNQSASVNFASSVTAAGALMDSELTAIASVKALNQGVATTDDPTFTNTQLAAIAQSKSDTAVDVFVYDTSKDSDGGAWRHRTQNTSWYNETLSTSTRGATKKFPSVAVIVAESNQVTIYDGDDPAMPMWMVFNSGGTAWGSNNHIGPSNISVTSVSCLNGQMVSGSAGVGGFFQNFILDGTTGRGTGAFSNLKGAISQRNSTLGLGAQINTSSVIVDNTINDVAMTVLPNAPIDADTGLPVPTIAVATNGGVSVIKDSVLDGSPDGSVVDITGQALYQKVMRLAFTSDNKIKYTLDFSGDSNPYSRYVRVDAIPSADFVATSGAHLKGNSLEFYSAIPSVDCDLYFLADINTVANPNLVIGKAYGTKYGLTTQDRNPTAPANGMVAYTASDYNTGWMNGDIKLATLSDTDTTNAVGTELVTNGTFASNTTGWTDYTSIYMTVSHASGVARLTHANNWSGWYGIGQDITTVVGKTYVASYDVTESDSGNMPGSHFYLGESTVLFGESGSYEKSGTITATFVATSTTTNIRTGHGGVGVGSGDYYTIDNFSVRLAEEDRSVNGNGLQVFGTVTKTAVATGADLVSYRSSGSSYLRQPQAGGLVLTNDFSMTWWQKYDGSGGTYEGWQIVEDDVTGSTNYAKVVISAMHQISTMSYLVRGANLGGFDTASNTISSNVWHCLCLTKVGSSIKLYIDGSLKASSTGTIVTPSNPYSLELLRWSYGTTRYLCANSELSLFRTSNTVPSPEQIAKIYNDEKHLFQENAQATLYGTSDAVTALAYDDDTELLHAGTSAGRSVFQGLRRVENTTDAVGSAISASNGLVAED